MNDYSLNLSALQKAQPHLAALVESIQLHPQRYALLETKTPCSTFEFRTDKGKTVLWHSRYDPLVEAKRDIETMDHSKVCLPIFLGMGLGFSLRYLYDHCRDEFYDVIVVERDPHIFKLALKTTRLDDVISDSRVHFHIGDNLAAWNEQVNTLLPSMMSCSMQFVTHPPSHQVYPHFYQSILDILKQRISLARAEFDLMIRSGPLIQENMWKNLPAISSSLGIRHMQGRGNNQPAVVVAAGPSLDKNIHLLKGKEDAFLMIVVDTAYRTVIKHGIEPHFVVTTDPSAINAKHFEGIVPSSTTILAFDPEVHHSIPTQWPHRKLFINLEKTVYTRWLENTLGPYGFLPKGGSVGHTAFFLARELGCDPILFVGLDLAFNPQGGTTHTADSALYRTHSAFAAGTTTAELSARVDAAPMQESIVWVEGINSPTVPTSRIMSLYIKQFEEEFTQTSSCIIDATEGGALLKGSQTMPLNKALQEFANNRRISEWFNNITIHPPKKHLSNNIEQILQTLTSSEQYAQRGFALSNLLTSRIPEGIRLRHAPEWSEMESCFSYLYQTEELKIAMEQALFAPVYDFIQKEKYDQVETRLRKYQVFFKSYLTLLPYFQNVIQSLELE